MRDHTGRHDGLVEMMTMMMMRMMMKMMRIMMARMMMMMMMVVIMMMMVRVRVMTCCSRQGEGDVHDESLGCGG